ncbi:MAG: hypothetical protein RIQ53_560 [Pseudomonadota bacterium]|jgi:hypothetical protein
MNDQTNARDLSERDGEAIKAAVIAAASAGAYRPTGPKELALSLINAMRLVDAAVKPPASSPIEVDEGGRVLESDVQTLPAGTTLKLQGYPLKLVSDTKVSMAPDNYRLALIHSATSVSMPDQAAESPVTSSTSSLVD